MQTGSENLERARFQKDQEYSGPGCDFAAELRDQIRHFQRDHADQGFGHGDGAGLSTRGAVRGIPYKLLSHLS